MVLPKSGVENKFIWCHPYRLFQAKIGFIKWVFSKMNVIVKWSYPKILTPEADQSRTPSPQRRHCFDSYEILFQSVCVCAFHSASF